VNFATDLLPVEGRIHRRRRVAVVLSEQVGVEVQGRYPAVFTLASINRLASAWRSEWNVAFGQFDKDSSTIPDEAAGTCH